MLKVILNSIVRNFVIIKEELFLTTHSMPSGSWVTALFNSLINRALTAICYYRENKKVGRKTNLLECLSIRDFVIGDDKLVGVPGHLTDIVNAYTMKDLAESLNMRYTDGTKGEISSKFKPLGECVFVKRNFRAHNQLNKFVGALSLQTIMNSILWCDSTRDRNIVMEGKFVALQYECFLHNRPDIVTAVAEEYDRLRLPYRIFSSAHIMRTMMDPDTYATIMLGCGKANFLSV